MIILADKKTCTGCAACMNICGKGAIILSPDEEGFMQPSIDTSLCVECGLCMKVCPQLTSKSEDKVLPVPYAAISLKHQKNGSSGGVFSALADFVLERQGIVYGAAFNQQFQLCHRGVTEKAEMQPLRGSKYLQSYIGFTYKEIKKHLSNNKLVLFCGTPCQVDGLKHFLRNKSYDNLITIDFTCHGVPSQAAFDTWIRKVEQDKGKISSFSFRKLDGWSILPKVKTVSGRTVYLRYNLEAYMWAFYEGYLFRESCYHCSYANLKRKSDLTLADYWGIGKYGIPFTKNQVHGVSLILANTQKGKQILDSIKSELYLEERTLDEALKEQHNLKKPSIRPLGRDSAAVDFLTDMSLVNFARKYHLLPHNKYKYILVSKIKDTLIDLGVFDVLKDFFYRIKR